MGQIYRNRREAAKWAGKIRLVAPRSSIRIGTLAADREFVTRPEARKRLQSVERRNSPRLHGGRQRAHVTRRFTVAWHEAIPSSFPLDPIEPLLDLRRAAHLLGISVKTLRDWIHARKIEYVKVGSRVMIRPETIRQ